MARTSSPALSAAPLHGERPIVFSWHQEPGHVQCPRCKQYTWYTDGNGNWKCTACGFAYGP